MIVCVMLFITCLSGEDERRIAVVVGQVGIDVIHVRQQLQYRHEAAGCRVTQPRLQRTNAFHIFISGWRFGVAVTRWS